eukprot:gene15593-biopygen20199
MRAVAFGETAGASCDNGDASEGRPARGGAHTHTLLFPFSFFFAVVVCCGAFLWLVVVVVCCGGLLWYFAVVVCCGLLLWWIAVVDWA